MNRWVLLRRAVAISRGLRNPHKRWFLMNTTVSEGHVHGQWKAIVEISDEQAAEMLASIKGNEHLARIADENWLTKLFAPHGRDANGKRLEG